MPRDDDDAQMPRLLGAILDKPRYPLPEKPEAADLSTLADSLITLIDQATAARLGALGRIENEYFRPTALASRVEGLLASIRETLPQLEARAASAALYCPAPIDAPIDDARHTGLEGTPDAPEAPHVPNTEPPTEQR